MPTDEPPAPIPGARLLFSLDPATAHLNHASYGAVPVSVQRAQQRLGEEMEADPDRFFTRGLLERLTHTRRHLAAFLGADPEGCALVTNSTTAASLALASVDLGPGDEVVTTDHGYGAVDFAVDRACAQTGARQRVVRLPLAPSDDEVVDGFRDELSARTRLVIVDQITSPTARLFPVERVVAAVRESAPAAVFVDAAHVPGQLPVRVDRLGADFWVGNLHKWAFAPRGTALLAVAPRWRGRMRPLVVSWQQPGGFPGSLEFHGTADYTPWLAAPAGLFVLRSLGVRVVRAHNAALVRHGQRIVGEALGIDAADVPALGAAPAMRIVPLPAGVAPDLGAAAELRRRIAAELGAEVAVNAWRGRGLLRLSAQVYNRAEDYHRLAHGLPALLGARIGG